MTNMHRTLLTLILLCVASALAAAEVQPLPELGPAEYFAGRQAAYEPAAQPAAFGYPSELSEPLPAEADVYVMPKKPEGKPGFFQQAAVTTTWLPRGDADDFGIIDFEFSAIFAMHAPTRESPLIFKPGSDIHLFDGPEAPDLPSKVYDEYLQIRWMSKLTDRLGVDVAVTPGVHTDFESGSEDGFRMTAHALTAYEWDPTTQLVLGVLYLDSNDISFFPVGGVIWTPNECVRYELVVPKPRIAWRTGVCCDVETWWYVAGEYGSGEWAITRASGARDVITLSDYRAIVGVERKTTQGVSSRFEVGYVFGRELEYESATPSIEPGDTVMTRVGLWY